jgi:hypothetical protein
VGWGGSKCGTVGSLGECMSVLCRACVRSRGALCHGVKMSNFEMHNSTA